MTTLDPSNYEYQVGGSLSIHAPSYIHRQADRDLYAALQAGHFCYVFNSRQMGKSSLRVQTMHRLKQAGVACIAIDMTRIGSEHLTPQQWYEQVISELWRAASLPGKVNLKTWLQDHPELSLVPLLAQFIEDILLPQFSHSQIVIFIDEIDTLLSIRFPVNDFFAFIRACYNQRVDHPQYQRLTFCLLGVATPADLMQDKTRTPFNIGQAIALHGFTPPEATSLAQGLIGSVPNPEQTLQEILYWTGGQPFLTQKLCQMVVANSAKPQLPNPNSQIADLVSAHLITAWESHDEPEHLRTIRDRLLRDEKSASQLLGLYAEILNQGDIPVDEGDGQMELRLTGLVVKQGDRLQVYNPIYAAVFNAAWVQKTLYSLRPYADSFRAWTNSDCRDESRLLRGQTLEEALTWASTRNLSNLDVEFLRESQAVENRETKQANAILSRANYTAKNRLKIASISLGIATLIGGGIAVWSNHAIRTAQTRVQQAQGIARLEKDSSAVLKRFEFDQQGALLTALRSAYQLQQLSQQHQLNPYPTSNPILALQTLLNRIDQRQIDDPSNGNIAISLQFSPQGDRLVRAIPNWNQDATQSFRDMSITVSDLQGVTLATFATGLSQRYRSIMLSPNGQSIAAIDDELCTTTIWNLQGKQLANFKRHVGSPEAVQFSPDSQYVLVFENDTGSCQSQQQVSDPSQGFSNSSSSYSSQTARFIDLQGNQRLVFKNGSPSYPLIEFSSKGDRFLTIENGSTPEAPSMRLWNLQGQQLASFKVQPGKDDTWRGIKKAVFNPNGQLIATVGDGEMIHLWSLQGQRLASFKAQQPSLETVQFSPDGRSLAAGGSDGTLQLWTVQGKLLWQIKGYDSFVKYLQFSPDGKRLATIGGDQISGIMWDLQGKRLQSFKGVPYVMARFQFSSDGQRIQAGEFLTDLQNSHTKQLGTNQGKIEIILFSPKGNVIVTYTRTDKTVRVYHPDGQLLSSFPVGDLGDPSTRFGSGIQISATGDRILTFHSSERDQPSSMRLWNLQGKQIARLPGVDWNQNLANPNRYYAEIISKDDKRGKAVRIWNLDGKLVTTLAPPLADQEIINRVRISPIGDHILTSTSKGSILWTSQGKQLAQFQDIDSNSRVYFRGDQSERLIGIDANTVIQWDFQGKRLTSAEPPLFRSKEGVPVSASPKDFSVVNPKFGQVVTSLGDNLFLWDMQGQPLATLRGELGWFGSALIWETTDRIQFSDRGDRIATLGNDGKVRSWDNYGNQLGEYEGYAMALSPDGKQIVVVSQADNIPRIWRVDDLNGLIQRGCDWLREKIEIDRSDPNFDRDMCTIKPK